MDSAWVRASPPGCAKRGKIGKKYERRNTNPPKLARDWHLAYKIVI